MRGKIIVKGLIVMGIWMLAYSLSTCSIVISAEKVKLTYWTHWGQNPRWNQWYSDTAKKFSIINPDVDLTVEVVNIPYEGYVPKYLSAFIGVKGAPDMFNGMTHQWAGKHSFADPMPEDFAQYLEDNLVPFLLNIGVWGGKRYGVPLESGNFQMLYINVDMFKEAGLDPNRPIKTYDQFLEYAKKLTKDIDGDGKLDQWGYGIRYKGHPLGIADKFVTPFLHAWGARMISIEERKASGYVNSENAVEALRFYGDLVNKYHVASLVVPNPAGAFGQKLVAMIFRESWYGGWLTENAPDIEYKIYPIPIAKLAPGATNMFPWTDMVYKNAPTKNKKWAWEYLKFINSPAMVLDHCQYQRLFPPPFKSTMLTEYAKGQFCYEAMIAMVDRPPAPTYYIPEAHELAYELGEAILDVIYRRATSEDALNTAAADMDEILKE